MRTNERQGWLRMSSGSALDADDRRGSRRHSTALADSGAADAGEIDVSNARAAEA